jgi:hypothetical protein
MGGVACASTWKNFPAFIVIDGNDFFKELNLG